MNYPLILALSFFIIFTQRNYSQGWEKFPDSRIPCRINKDKNNDSLHEEKGIEDLSNKVVITGGSMLNNINSRGLSKSKEVDVLNFPGATSSDVLTKIDDVLNKKQHP